MYINNLGNKYNGKEHSFRRNLEELKKEWKSECLTLNGDFAPKSTKRNRHQSELARMPNLADHEIEKYDEKNHRKHIACIVCAERTTFCCRDCDNENPVGYCKQLTTGRKCFKKGHTIVNANKKAKQ